MKNKELRGGGDVFFSVKYAEMQNEGLLLLLLVRGFGDEKNRPLFAVECKAVVQPSACARACTRASDRACVPPAAEQKR